MRDAIEHRRHNSTLRCGAIAFYTDWAAPKRKNSTIASVIESFENKFEENAKNYFPKVSGYSFKLERGKINHGKSGDAWRAYCLFVEISKPRTTDILRSEFEPVAFRQNEITKLKS